MEPAIFDVFSNPYNLVWQPRHAETKTPLGEQSALDRRDACNIIKRATRVPARLL
jgi:hypothetical protein